MTFNYIFVTKTDWFRDSGRIFRRKAWSAAIPGQSMQTLLRETVNNSPLLLGSRTTSIWQILSKMLIAQSPSLILVKHYRVTIKTPSVGNGTTTKTRCPKPLCQWRWSFEPSAQEFDACAIPLFISPCERNGKTHRTDKRGWKRVRGMRREVTTNRPS